MGDRGIKKKVTETSIFELSKVRNFISRLCIGPFTNVSHYWWKQSFPVFGACFDRPSTGLQVAKNILLYPSRHILSQHPHSHPLEWLPRGHQARSPKPPT